MSTFPDSILEANNFELTDAHRNDMRLSSRWTRFLGILTLLGALLVIASIIIGLITIEQQHVPSDLRTQVYVAFLFLLVFSIINLFLGYTLFKYGKSLRDASTGLQFTGINNFFRQQNSFWKFLGSYIGIIILLYILLIIVSV